MKWAFLVGCLLTMFTASCYYLYLEAMTNGVVCTLLRYVPWNSLHLSLVLLAVKKGGADLKIQDATGANAFFRALTVRSIEVMEYLADQNDLEIANVHGNTPSTGEPLVHWVARQGDMKLLRFFLDRRVGVHTYGKDNKTLLHSAASRLFLADGSGCNLAMVQFLVQEGLIYGAMDSYGANVLHYAAAYAQLHIVEWLLSLGQQLEDRDHAGNTALYYAILPLSHLHGRQSMGGREKEAAADGCGDGGGERGTRKEVQAMVSFLIKRGIQDGEEATEVEPGKGMSLEAVNEGGDTVFMATVAMNELTMASILLAHGANIDATDNDGASSLHFCAKMGRAQMALLLLQHNINAMTYDLEGLLPLHVAAIAMEDEVLKILVESGKVPVDALSKDEGSYTALHLTAITGNFAMVEFLVQHGANVNAKNADGETPLHRSVYFPKQKENREVMLFLLNHGADVFSKAKEEEIGTPLDLAIRKNNVVAMAVLGEWHNKHFHEEEERRQAEKGGGDAKAEAIQNNAIDGQEEEEREKPEKQEL